MALEEPAIIVVSGVQGAGKSTVARALAERFSRAVHIAADTPPRLTVPGAEGSGGPGGPPGQAAPRPPRRPRPARPAPPAALRAGFTAVVDDIIIGERFDDLRADLAGLPFRLVVLAPDLETAIERDAAREYTIGEEWARYLDEEQRKTMAGSGLWVDSSGQTAAETVEEVMSRLRDEGLVESEAS